MSRHHTGRWGMTEPDNRTSRLSYVEDSAQGGPHERSPSGRYGVQMCRSEVRSNMNGSLVSEVVVAHARMPG